MSVQLTQHRLITSSSLEPQDELEKSLKEVLPADFPIELIRKIGNMDDGGRKLPPPRLISTPTQKALLVATVICGIIASIPSLRFFGSLIGRGIALLTSSSNCASRWSEDSIFERILKVAKLAIVGLGIAAVAASSPMLIVASLIADLAIQVIEIITAFYHGEFGKLLSHCGTLLVDIFVLAAILSGHWQLMVTAAAISIVAMITITCVIAERSRRIEDIIDGICYVALAALGLTQAITVAEWQRSTIISTRFSGKNDTAYPWTLYNGKEPVAVIKPFSTYDFTLEGEHYGLYIASEGPPRYNSYGYLKNYLFYNDYNYLTEVTKNPLAPQLFPTVPLSGPNVEIPAAPKIIEPNRAEARSQPASNDNQMILIG